MKRFASTLLQTSVLEGRCTSNSGIKENSIGNVTAMLETARAYQTGSILTKDQKRQTTVNALVIGKMTPSLARTTKEQFLRWMNASQNFVLLFPCWAKKRGWSKRRLHILLNRIKAFVKTITFDNGKEFSRHEHTESDMFQVPIDHIDIDPFVDWASLRQPNLQLVFIKLFMLKLIGH